MKVLFEVNKQESERLIFRDLQEDDAKKLFEIYSDKEAMKYRYNKPMTMLEDARNFIRNQKKEQENHITIRKGVELKAQNELIGSVMYKYNKEIDTECIIGYSIGSFFWNRGLGREIVHFLVEELKGQSKIKIIKAWTIKENIGSNRILELNGFKQICQEDFADSYLYLKKI